MRLRHPAWEPAVFPLAEPAASVLVGGPPLLALQLEAAAAEGAPVADVPADAPLPAGTQSAWTADAVFSGATLAALREEGRRRKRPVQAAIRAHTPLWRAASRLHPITGDLPLPLWAGPLGGRVADVTGAPAAAFPDAEAVPLCDEATALAVRVPPHGLPPHVIHIPRVRRLGGQVRHWLHALDLSLAALETRKLERKLTDDAGASDRNVLLGDADIHPTATVLGSILDHGVKVEAHASVVGCFLGKDVLVADHSVLHTAVLGDGCRTLVDTSLRRIVAMGGSTLSNLALADVIIGREVFLTTAVATFDPTPGADVVVDGRDTGRAVLGGAIGARCVLGTRALLKAGVALPPGLLVVARPGEAVLKLDDASLARAHMLRGRWSEHV